MKKRQFKKNVVKLSTKDIEDKIVVIKEGYRQYYLYKELVKRYEESRVTKRESES